MPGVYSFSLWSKNMESLQNKISPSVAIIITGIIIAGAILFSSRLPAPAAAIQPQGQAPQPTGDLEAMTAVTAGDHIRGDINAPVKVVEYSDTECPFCKQFHNTMKQVVSTYGSQVAWIYRHFPLDSLHAKARKEAVALECAGDQGGNDKFWAYADRVYEVTPSNDGLDAAELPKIAQYVGLDVAEFNSCLTSGKFDKHIQDEVANATATGGQGTPWSIVVGKDEKKYPLSGALPYANVKQIIDQALK